MYFGTCAKGVFLKAILILAWVVLSGCSSEEPVRLGFVASITGRLADSGISSRDAVQMAVEQCNEQGGIHGHRVALIIRDDQGKTETGVRVVLELIDADVEAILGPLISDMAIAVIPYLNTSHLPAVSPTVTSTQMTGLDDYFFRVCMTVREYAYQSAGYQIRSGLRRIAVAYDSSHGGFCEDWLRNFKGSFVSEGGKILKVVAFQSNESPSFSEIAGRLLDADADGILVIADPMDSALLCQQIRKSDPSIAMTVSNWAASPRFIELGGRAVEGVTVSSAILSGSPGGPFRAFRKIYFSRYHREPDYTAILSYDAARMVLNALKIRNPGQSVKDALLSVGEFNGLRGKILFDDYGDVKPSQALIWVVKNREFVEAK